MNTVKTLKPHISLNVNNVDKSVEFYSKLFGIEPFKVQKGYAKFDVQNPPLNFTLNESASAKGGTLSHLGIQVETTEDVLKTRERWTAEGLSTFDEMQVDCCYALQDKTWTRDPDGNEWEVFVVLENTEGKENSCACGVKAEEEELSATGCCAETANPININRSAQTCC